MNYWMRRRRRQEELSELRKNVSHRIRSIQERYIRKYDEHRKESTFKVGDQVYAKKMFVRPNENKKLAPKYEGPFDITKVYTDNLVRINRIRKNPVIHVDKLQRRYVDDSTEEESSSTEVAYNAPPENQRRRGGSGVSTQFEDASPVTPSRQATRKSTRKRTKPTKEYVMSSLSSSS